MSDPGQAFERHHRSIYRYLVGLGLENAAAQDVVQETFLRALRMASRSQGWNPQSEVTWLFAVARNLVRNRWRDGSRHPPLVAITDREETCRVMPDRAVLRDALSRLPAGERDAFLLRELGGLSYREIAQITESTGEAVRSRIHRARIAMRRMLQGSPQMETTS